jgi:hypothetical protein
MLEGLVFAVDIGQEVFCAFRKVQDGGKIDDFGTGVSYRGKRLGEQFQISASLFLYRT